MLLNSHICQFGSTSTQSVLHMTSLFYPHFDVSPTHQIVSLLTIIFRSFEASFPSSPQVLVHRQQFLVIIINKMQIQQREGKTKYTYVTDQSTPPINNKRELTICLKCQSWQQKSQELIWGYEELLSAKEKELQTMTTMVNQLDDKLRKAYSKIDNLNRKIQGYESQTDKGRSNQEIINYYKEREEDLLAQLHAAENELFAKSVLIKDEIDSKEDKALTELFDQSKNNKSKPKTPKNDASLIPIISTTQTLGKMLQRNICDLEKMGQEKMMLEVKHRMAVLRAVQLSVLK